MSESRDDLAALRRRVAAMALGGLADAQPRFATGHAAIDRALGGGLARGRVHELFAGDGEAASSAAGFAVMLALRAQIAGAPILWLRSDEAMRRGGALHAPGLVELGGDPASLLLGIAPDLLGLLRVASDAARCGGLGAILIECWGEARALDLTASRRLALAAEQSGVPLLLLRIDARPVPGAADTRWQVHSAPSQPLAGNAPGQTMLDIELLRHRSGFSGMRWRVEWNRDERIFCEPALSGAVVPLPVGGSAALPAAGPLRRTG